MIVLARSIGTSFMTEKKKKLKQQELKAYRGNLLQLQEGKCYLCRQVIVEGEEVLDHDHKSGYTRGVLHRDCNILLGKIENFLHTRGKSLKGSLDRQKMFFEEVLLYMYTDWSTRPLHPTHRTETDKLIRQYQKRIKRAKRESTKQKYRDLIRSIKNERQNY